MDQDFKGAKFDFNEAILINNKKVFAMIAKLLNYTKIRLHKILI